MNNNGKEKIQFKTLGKNDYFNSCFKKLVFGEKLNEIESQFILEVAIIFFKYYNNDRRFKGYFNIAYYIILKYSLIHNNYKPIYDISLQIGFYPISDFILKNNLLEEYSLFEATINLEIEKRYRKETYIETIEQFNRSKEVFTNIINNDTAYIAPTSYGKSSIIREIIRKQEFDKIAVIVPSKSLLIQTYNDIRNSDLTYKLILHDEMYNENYEKFIGILTQERATRLLNKFNVSFDVLFVDEAHNLLKNDTRNYLLSRLIMLNYRRNQNQRVLYLSPLVNDVQNLKVKNTSNQDIYGSIINHNLKEFDIFFLDKEKKLTKYNRFSGELYYMKKLDNEYLDYVIDSSKEKNFIYHHKPKKVEEISNDLSNKLSIENSSDALNEISNVIADEVSSEIDLVTFIQFGIIYLHGKQPNILKEYLEYKFKNIPQLKYVIANSVILEGINFPIDNLFITSTYRLQAKDLKNLIGRVNRLNYVFRNSLTYLISDIHFIENENLNSNSMLNKIELLRDSTFKDVIKNPLLEEYDINKLNLPNEDKERRKQKDEKLISDTYFLLDVNPNNFEEKVKHYFIENNLDDFYYNTENVLNKLIQNISKITDSTNVILSVYEIFIIDLENEIKDFELERLKNEKARKYYKNYLELIQIKSLKEKIKSTLEFFIKKSNEEDSYLYIGQSFGEVLKESEKYKNNEYLNKVYVDLKDKSKQELANLALVKIKLEEDFVSFKLKKLITFLYDFEIIDSEIYNLAIYGSDDIELINLTRIGLSPSIARVVKENHQLKNIKIDNFGNLTSNSDFHEFLNTQPELTKFELNKYIK